MALTERWAVSRTDVLTGLLNRRAFHGHLKLEWARSHRYEFPMACVMIDLDYFKRVNDTFGHHAGDRVLKIVAEQLKSHCRASDYICRHGGEELCVLLPHTDEAGAAAWAEHTRQAIASAPVLFGEHSMQLTASFGVSERLVQDDTMEQMIDRADQSLLVAKKSGRNRVVHFSSTTASGESALQQAGGRGNVFQGVLVSQVMNAPVASLPADATAGEAAEFFLKSRINSAPVVDEEGKLIGILSEKDVLGIIFSQDAWTTPIEKIMQCNVVCYEEDADVQSICEFLSRVTIRRVVIVRDGRPTGVVSRGSLLRWYANAMGASDSTNPTAALSHSDESTRLKLIESAQAVAHCASQLADSISETVDDLTVPVIEGISKLQQLVNDFLAGTVDREPRASIADALLPSLDSSANTVSTAVS